MDDHHIFKNLSNISPNFQNLTERKFMKYLKSLFCQSINNLIEKRNLAKKSKKIF